MTIKRSDIRACSNCGSPKVAVVCEAWVEMVSDAKKKHGNVLRPRFDLVICPNCGLTQMFARKDEHFLLDTCDHQLVDVSAPSPYR